MKTLILLFLLSITPVSNCAAYQTEREFDAEMLRLENDIKKNRPDVIWVNAEQYAKEIRNDRLQRERMLGL